ncbi:hypothetical protein DSL92_02670 [Billgrantia gudaonensis]|uniref:Uncharacterized protein n=1 Tax=Billgrantia gudaonensis TaxID=376427 RepID=A0A3S0QS36_9GAMM|nr:hypothetical protein DSL92_02670 [Halomonas gudaonensis]
MTHYTYDAHSLAHGTGKSIVEDGGDTWFFTVDFAFGIGLEEQVSNVVREATRSSALPYPLDTTDFSSYPCQARPQRGDHQYHLQRRRHPTRSTPSQNSA